MAQEILSNIYERVREKKEAYGRYNFERVQEEAFATFFDLAQEVTTIENLYQIAVAVPKEFLDLESRLYILQQKKSQLEKVCTSEGGFVPVQERLPVSMRLGERPYEAEASWVFPIKGNKAFTKLIPYAGQSHILGLFEVFPKERVDARKLFFLEKFANRIGYNLHQKMLIQQNIDHIKFINQLVSDIEHNVISPNMYYKLFLLQLKKNLATYMQVAQRLRQVAHTLRDQPGSLQTELRDLQHLLEQTNHALEEERQSLAKHYEHTSLFLETLLRRDHFEKGTYVLRKQSCNFRSEIIQPLIERYLPIFHRKGIAVENSLANVPDEQVTLFVDKGLISQVFDNLFSNAVKYAQQVRDEFGHRIKLVSYNRQILKDYFGEGIPGVRFNFFTTGTPLSREDAERIFDEGFRASSAGKERGTGHGLHFVKNVVEIHGGTVGCEPQHFGNLIYFVLPVKEHGSLAGEPIRSL